MATVERRARVSNGPIVLTAVINGTSLDEIAISNQLTRKQAERALRAELRKRWIAPAQDHARLQIARLEAIAILLKDKATKGDLPTIDRLLKVLDRLDRYHGFTKLTSRSSSTREDMRPRLGVKINQMAALEAPK